ncbi:MAG: hypothetical protein ACI4MB_00820 [Candidatus Coproplasma sp.]
MKAKDFAIIGVFTALLLGGQFALSFVAGIEVVTVLLLTFAYHFGFRRSLIVANAFCILRCFIFGFFPTVVILYFIYYNLFVLLFAFVGKKFKGRLSAVKLVIIVSTAALANACFTLLDDVITPLFYSFDQAATKAYFIASLYTMATHVVCTIITVTLLFPPLISIFEKSGKT